MEIKDEGRDVVVDGVRFAKEFFKRMSTDGSIFKIVSKEKDKVTVSDILYMAHMTKMEKQLEELIGLIEYKFSIRLNP